MASGVHKYSAYEAAAFILASDCENNGAFGDELILESSDSYDSEEEPCFPDMEVDKTQKNDQQVCFKNYYFCFFVFGTFKSFDVSCGHPSTVLKYSNIILFCCNSCFIFLFYCREAVMLTRFVVVIT